MKINSKDLKDGKEMYLFLGGLARDGSGNGILGCIDNADLAMRYTGEQRIFKVVLEEIPLEYVEEQRVITEEVLRPIKK
jgi:hypothetical protein